MSLPEGVTVKEGGYYRTRGGRTAGPVVMNDDVDVQHRTEFPWVIDFGQDGGMESFRSDGSWAYVLGEPAKLDLVYEMPNPLTDVAARIVDSILPTGSQARKDTPVYSGVMAYFPRALAYVAQVSKAGNDKHNPGQPLHWSKDKSNDHADCVARHLIEHGTIDPDDNLRHTGKLAWRALALLETELEKAAKEAAGSFAA